MGISRVYVFEHYTWLSALLIRFLCLKTNILIGQDRRACLADFGILSTILSDPTASSTFAGGEMTRWMSPELLDPDQFSLRDSQPTEASDCYALGMVIYEVLTGLPPFVSCKEVTVQQKVTKGERPARPQGEEGERFTDTLWDTVQTCWWHAPTKRPTIKEVTQFLELELKEFATQTDGDTNSSSNNQSRFVEVDTRVFTILSEVLS